MKAIPLLLIATTLHGAEPRFQFRSFIQIDGSLMHVKLDTTTGQTWRLERTLANRRDTTIAGKATERKLAEAKHAHIDSIDGYTLPEALVTVHALNKHLTGNDGVQFVFRNPAAGRDANGNRPGHHVVSPAQPFGGPPQAIDPVTGLPFRRSGQPGQTPPLPGIAPGSGAPLPGGGTRPLPGLGQPQTDPTTGLPFTGGLHGGGGLPGSGGHGFPGGDPALRRGFGSPLGPMDANLVKIRNWQEQLRNISTLHLISEMLNTLDQPVRCVIDENIVYFLPESATLITRDGKTNRPKYEEHWVEIKVGKKE